MYFTKSLNLAYQIQKTHNNKEITFVVICIVGYWSDVILEENIVQNHRMTCPNVIIINNNIHPMI